MRLRDFTEIMSSMANGVCGHCGHKTHFTAQWGSTVDSGFQLAATCDHCKKLSIAISKERSSQLPQGVRDWSLNSIDNRIGGYKPEWWPKFGDSPEIDDVPEHIGRAAEEAYKCFSIGAFMAAILMARTVIEASAKNKGITSGTLQKKIEELEKQDLIRKNIKNFAHEIRDFGNEMAHGDIEEIPSAEDAEEVLALMRQVLKEVFQGDALLERLRSRRNKDGSSPQKPITRI